MDIHQRWDYPAFVPAPLAALPQSPPGFRAEGAQSLQPSLGILRVGCSPHASSMLRVLLRAWERMGNVCEGKGDEISPGNVRSVVG